MAAKLQPDSHKMLKHKALPQIISFEVGIISTWPVEKLREGNRLVQGHTIFKWRMTSPTQIFGSGSLA